MKSQAPEGVEVTSIGFIKDDTGRRTYRVFLKWPDGETTRCHFEGPIDGTDTDHGHVVITDNNGFIKIERPSVYGVSFDKVWIERFYDTAGQDVGMITVTPPCCPLCGLTEFMQVDAVAYGDWAGGKLIQDAFPDWTPERREQLKTGYHEHCWKLEEQYFEDQDRRIEEHERQIAQEW